MSSRPGHPTDRFVLTRNCISWPSMRFGHSVLMSRFCLSSQILAERVRAQLRARMTLPSGSAELWVLSRGLGILVHYAFVSLKTIPYLVTLPRWTGIR